LVRLEVTAKVIDKIKLIIASKFEKCSYIGIFLAILPVVGLLELIRPYVNPKLEANGDVEPDLDLIWNAQYGMHLPQPILSLSK